MTPLVCPNDCGVPIVDGPEVSADNPWAAQLIADHLHMECPRAAVARTLDVAEATADKARAVGLARETAS